MPFRSRSVVDLIMDTHIASGAAMPSFVIKVRGSVYSLASHCHLDVWSVNMDFVPCRFRPCCSGALIIKVILMTDHLREIL